MTVQQALEAGTTPTILNSFATTPGSKSASACPLVSNGRSAIPIPILTALLLCAYPQVREGCTAKQYFLNDSHQGTKFLEL